MKPAYYAIVLSLGYAVTTAAYIWISGHLAAQVASNLVELEQLERIKGLAFVAVTTLLLLLASFMLFRRLHRAVQERERERLAIIHAQGRVLAGELAAAIAHDFRNLLLVIGAALDRLNTDPADHEAMLDAEQGVQRGAELALRLARTARGQHIGSLQYLDIGALVQSTVKMLRRLPKLLHSQIDISCEVPVFGHVDETLFEQMVANLLLNAADAVDGHGKIRLIVSGNADGFRLEVQDSGSGIPEAERDVVFSAFTTTKTTGLGLGLLSVKATAESHGGSVRAESSPLGGASFIIEVPHRPMAPTA